MMGYAHTTGATGLLFFGTFHMIGMIGFFTGFLFLMFWAYKHLTPAQLYRHGWTLIGISVVLCLVSFLMLPFGGMRAFHYGDRDVRMMQWQDNADEYGMEDMMGFGDESAMTMDDMVASLEGKTGDDFDQAFIAEMIPHHQGAIDMAKLAMTSAKHDEIKKLAAAIMAAQQKEISTMESWQKAWGYAK